MGKRPPSVEIALVNSVSWSWWVRLLSGSVASLLIPLAGHCQTWLDVTDIDLEVPSGSLLDFSRIFDNPRAGSFGWAVPLKDGAIGFERRKRPQRFFAASFAFSPASGGFPPPEEADRIVTQLRRSGYNAVRLQNVDAMLMTKRIEDFDYDPVQLDRFDYLFARLKDAGIYVVLDVMYLDNGAYGNVLPHRWVKRHNLRQDMYSSEVARAHWLRLLKSMVGRPNKYSGTVPLNDPALLALVLINEGGVLQLAHAQPGGLDAPYPSAYQPAFKEWLRRRYGSDERLNAAWGAEKLPDEGLTSYVAVPQAIKGRGQRHRDFAQFVIDLESDLALSLERQAKSLGFGGLTTAFNSWSSWQSDLSRRVLPLVDMHAYHTLPTSFTDPGSRVGQNSAIADGARFVRELATARQWGKPFSVTEYGQPFWNSWRHESVALVPAYASLQGWDLIAQFTETPIQLRYEKSRLPRRAAIHPFGIGADPVLRAGERLAALLYRRGDVQRSPAHVAVVAEPKSLVESGQGLSQLDESISRLALVHGVGLQFDTRPQQGPGNSMLIPVGQRSVAWESALRNAATRIGLGKGDQDRVDELKGAGLLAKTNRTSFSGQVFESDTGELLLDARQSRFSVSTPRTVVIVTSDAPVSSGPLTLYDTTVPVTLSLSAMDNEPLAHSRRMLLMVLTDAQNSNMVFRDAKRTTLEKLGGLPVKLQSARINLRWVGGSGAKLKAWSLALNGERRDAIELTETEEGWRLNLDLSRLPGGPTPYFEIADQ